jgi:hypothetical protein
MTIDKRGNGAGVDTQTGTDTGMDADTNAAARAARQRWRNATAGFDRLRPHQPVGQDAPAEAPAGTVGRDAHGKRVLYSGTRPPPTINPGVVVTCSRCRRTSTVGLGRAVRVLTPSVHLPLLRNGHPSLLRCPACGKISWVRLGLRVRTASSPS